jgi:hypothetical protein
MFLVEIQLSFDYPAMLARLLSLFSLFQSLSIRKTLVSPQLRHGFPCPHLNCREFFQPPVTILVPILKVSTKHGQVL